MIVGRYKSGCGWLSLDARTVTRGMTEGQRVPGGLNTLLDCGRISSSLVVNTHTASP